MADSDSNYKLRGIKSSINISQKTTKLTERSSSVSLKENKIERTDSKISNRITKTFLENENKYLTNPEDYDKIKEESILESLEDLVKTPEDKEIIINEPIKMNIYIPDKKEEIKKFILVRITNRIKVNDLVKQSLEMFNDLFNREGVPYMLNTQLNDYYIRPSKKSGKPDFDLPKLGDDYLVAETNMTNFSLIFENKDLIAITPRKSIFDKCKPCIIY